MLALYSCVRPQHDITDRDLKLDRRNGTSSNALSTTSGANVDCDASHGANMPRRRKRRRQS
jgi:hypothetical protein